MQNCSAYNPLVQNLSSKIKTVGFLIISILGSIGNPLFYYCMSLEPYRNIPFAVLIRFIIIGDSILVVLALIRVLESLNIFGFYKTTQCWPAIYMYVCYNCSTNWILMLLTIERVVCIWLHIVPRVKKGTWKRLALFICIMFALLAIPLPFTAKFDPILYKLFGLPCTFKEGYQFIAAIWSIMYNIICVFFPLCATIVCWIMMVFYLYSQKNREVLQNTKSLQLELTKILLLITIVHNVIESPIGLLLMIEVFLTILKICKLRQTWSLVVAICLLVSYTNCCTKFYLFILPSRRFRKQISKIKFRLTK